MNHVGVLSPAVAETTLHVTYDSLRFGFVSLVFRLASSPNI